MSNNKFNFRIGMLHIKITNDNTLVFSINYYHKWLARPFFELYICDFTRSDCNEL